MELLETLEQDAELKRQMRDIMVATSTRCGIRAQSADRNAAKLDLTQLCHDWRNTEGLSTTGSYRRVWYNIRESGEAALTQLMDRNTPFSKEQQTLLTQAITRLDYDKVSSGGIFYLQGAYWKARKRGYFADSE